MNQMHIAIPEDQKRWTKEQAEREGFSNVSEYVRHLIREERKRREAEWLERQLLEAMNSTGESIEVDENFWQSVDAHLAGLPQVNN